MILHIVEAEVCGPRHLRLRFNDGVSKRVDLGPLLHGPIFEPLRDPARFAQAELDEEFGVVHWPNGADFAPEALHELADLTDDDFLRDVDVDGGIRSLAGREMPFAETPSKGAE